MGSTSLSGVRFMGIFCREYVRLISQRPIVIWSARRIACLSRPHEVDSDVIQKRRVVTVTSREDGVMRSPYPDVVIPDTVNLADYVMKDFGKFGDTEALVDGVSGRVITFSQLKTSVTRVASALTRMGLGAGDVITICSPNLPEYAVLYLAVVAVGGIVSTVNPLYTTDELRWALDHTKSKLVVTIPQLVAVVKAATKDNPQLKGVVVLGPGADGCRPYSDLLADDGRAFQPHRQVKDSRQHTAALLFSSGTTGLPKAVMLTHYNIIANIQQTVCTEEMVKYDRVRDSLLGLLPFFHVFGQVAVMLGALKNGVKLVTMPKFEPELFLQLMQGHRITTVHVAPPVVVFLAKHPYVEMYNLHHLRTMVCGAAPVGPKAVTEMVNRLNLPNFAFRQGFGMTEASPVTHINPPTGFKYDSVGHAVHNTEFKIVDVESGASLGPGHQGELLVRGPQIMKGYFDNPQATAEAIDAEGWLHTGDLGHYDVEQHVYITDRLKELIKVKGLQVAPAELEGILLSHPGIQDAGVIGIPDDRAGELPRAYVTLRPDVKLTAQDVQNFVKGKVAPYKELTGGVEFLAEIPKNLSGKILRRELKEEYLRRQ